MSIFSNDDSLRSLYGRVLPSFKKLVMDNSGHIEDAEDLLQESIILCYKKIKEPDFILTSKLETFIIGIGKRKWMHELRKKGRYSAYPEIEDEGNTIDEMIIHSERRTLYVKHFESLSDSCKKVLRLFFEGLNMNEIAARLDFKSEAYARKRKHNCQSKLIDLIKRDELYVELANG
jgi:RNA polymerase sigma factor (sigma-70 family)